MKGAIFIKMGEAQTRSYINSKNVNMNLNSFALKSTIECVQIWRSALNSGVICSFSRTKVRSSPESDAAQGLRNVNTSLVNRSQPAIIIGLLSNVTRACFSVCMFKRKTRKCERSHNHTAADEWSHSSDHSILGTAAQPPFCPSTALNSVATIPNTDHLKSLDLH